MLIEEDNQELATIGQEDINFFWKRILAIIIDIFILGLTGSIVGQFFIEQFVKLGSWAQGIGFMMSLLYFGILNSYLGGGQTLGKRLTKIKVVNHQGEYLTVNKSCLRFSIFGLAFLVNILPEINFFWITFNLILFGIAGGIVYFYLFNTDTRQALHDIICNSYVVQSQAVGKVRLPRIAKRHFVIFSVIFFATLILGGSIFQLFSSGVIPSELKEVREELYQVDNYLTVQLNIDNNYQEELDEMIRTIQVLVNVKEQVRDEAAAKEIKEDVIEKIINEYHEASEMDYIEVTVARGYDLGIFSDWERYNQKLSTQEWLVRLE
ncbi:RDD family protein [Natroniella acetigena]|uniref:RDD family protein n=1 Tax=Natroniella acetigena TaxID=52004 RepID=UPI00200B866C|nr:RDD family protein [Natroniella acetigena]MCK8827361.1 RDD family protein [Natroniella acetigena]